MLTSRRIVGALCAGSLLVSACSSGTGEPEDGASPTDTASPVATASPSPTASASPEDPWAVPDPITEEYVDRVVNRIYEEWGAITREILEQDPDPTGTTPVEVRERIAELFGGSEFLLNRFEEATDTWRGDRENLLPATDFTSVKWTTRRLVEANEACMVAIGDFDTTGTAQDGSSLLSAISLEPTSPQPANPTGWLVIDALANIGHEGEVLDDAVMLEASLEDFGEMLEHTCAEEGGA